MQYVNICSKIQPTRFRFIFLAGCRYRNLRCCPTRCRPFHPLSSCCLCCRRYRLSSVAGTGRPELPLVFNQRPVCIARLLYCNQPFVFGLFGWHPGFDSNEDQRFWRPICCQLHHRDRKAGTLGIPAACFILFCCRLFWFCCFLIKTGIPYS